MNEFVATIMLDLSGSFSELMTKDGKAYGFALRVVDRLFRERMGSSDKIIIGQLSGSDLPMLWEGRPIDLRGAFPNSEAFGKFLASKANPGGSRIHDGIADAVDYLLNYPGIAEGKTRSALFVLSDMLDNAPEPEKSRDRLLKALTVYGQRDVAVGFYWVHHPLVLPWRTDLQNAGIRHFVVESQIVADPQLPKFE